MSISTRNSKIQAHVGGLSKEEISKMEGIFHRFEELESVILFAFEKIGSSDLLKHIDEHGKLIYQQ